MTFIHSQYLKLSTCMWSQSWLQILSWLKSIVTISSIEIKEGTGDLSPPPGSCLKGVSRKDKYRDATAYKPKHSCSVLQLNCFYYLHCWQENHSCALQYAHISYMYSGNMIHMTGHIHGCRGKTHNVGCNNIYICTTGNSSLPIWSKTSTDFNLS